jgi:tetratricopeptide (TPR) repeat protein
VREKYPGVVASMICRNLRNLWTMFVPPLCRAVVRRWQTLGICLLLGSLTGLVFAQTLRYPFLNYDDGAYVYRNPHVMNGLSSRGIVWAFTHVVAANWHPLTVISHMLVCQLGGVNATWHHFTNVILHAVAVVLLFLALAQMTTGPVVGIASGSVEPMLPLGSPMGSKRARRGGAGRGRKTRRDHQLQLAPMSGSVWPSAFVSAVFAIHPLRVESVAWIAERKDVLSAVFFMLTLLAYARFVRRPTVTRYVTMSVLFALGLLAKPMLVTLPFVLFLLDYWPLRRIQSANGKGQTAAAFAKALARQGGKRMEDRNQRSGITGQWSVVRGLVFEKIPLLVLSAAACAAALVSQSQSHSMVPVGVSSLPSRISNAFVACVTYVWQMVWPLKLAVFYPEQQERLPFEAITLSIAFLMLISALALISRKRRPYFFTGWFWYVGMLVPVIGIVQVGLQAHADRYTYLPQIGLYLAITWAAVDASRAWRHRKIILGVAAATILTALTWRAWLQTSYWRDSESLWRHALDVTGDNVVARVSFCDALLYGNKLDEAAAEAREILQMWPANAHALGMLGISLAWQGRADEALPYLFAASESNTNVFRLHYNLANVLFQKGKVDEAIAHYRKELEANPDFAECQNDLANALLRKGQFDEAVSHLQKALELNSNYADARNNLGMALSQKGDTRDAIAQWNKTLQIQPDNIDANSNLAWALATFPDASIRDGTKAIEFAKRALQISGGKNARIWRLAAAAYAENGRFPDAIEAAQNALRLADAEGNSSLARTLEMNIVLFQQNLPLRDTTQNGWPKLSP